MIILNKNKDLFKFKDSCSLGHGVNSEGVMGAGIAVKFKQYFIEMFQEYRQLCLNKTLRPGDCYSWKYNTNKNLYVYNLFIKDEWREKSKIEWVDSAFHNLFEQMAKNNDKEIAIPLIACGLGGLKWEKQVQPVVEKYNLNYPDINIHVCVWE